MEGRRALSFLFVVLAWGCCFADVAEREPFVEAVSFVQLGGDPIKEKEAILTGQKADPEAGGDAAVDAGLKRMMNMGVGDTAPLLTPCVVHCR